jgi:hypothetical protein
MNKYVFDNNALVVLCITVVIIAGIVFKVDGVKEIILALGSGLVGFLTGKVTADK